MQKRASYPQWNGTELVICNSENQRAKERHLQIIKKKNVTQKFYTHSIARAKKDIPAM